MNIRIELIRRVQAGDPMAAQTLVEQYQPVVFRIALSILDNPLDAAAASREAFTAALNQLNTLSAATDFSAWLTQIVVATCQASLNRRRTRLWMERIKRAVFRAGRQPPTAHAGAMPPGERDNGLWPAFSQLEERDRLALVLRYDHHMLPHEIVLAMGGRERVLQARLFAARERLRAAWTQIQTPPQPFQSVHPKVVRLIQSAADRQITDKDALVLEGHLQSCPVCQSALHQFRALEETMQAMFHWRWDEQPVPAADFTRSVLENRRLKHASRHMFNLVGAVMVTLIVVAGIIELPSLIPAAPIPAPVQPTPFRALQSWPTHAIPPNEPALVNQIYPGRLAFSTGQGFGGYQGTNGHLFTIQPNGGDLKDLEIGLMGVTAPVWSPDGKQIAYLGFPEGRLNNQVFVAQADGSKPHQISQTDYTQDDGSIRATPTPQPQQNRYPLYGPPQWSPDGSQIITTLWLSPDSSNLVALSVDGSLAQYLKVDGIDRNLIKWSPDGQFISYIKLTGSALWFWNPNQPEITGQNPRRIEFGPTWDVTFGMDWSPDSKHIALLTGVNQDQVEVKLYIVDLFNYEVKIAPISAGILPRNRIRNSALAWSPDGSYLAFNLAFRDSDFFNNRLLLIRQDGTGLQTLVNMDRGVRDFTWSPDGRWIAFTSEMDFWGVSMQAFELNQTYLVRLASQAGFQLSWQKVN